MIAPPRPPSHHELEALIKEARARQLRRRLFGTAAVALAVALGLSAYAVGSARTHRTDIPSGGRPEAAAASCNVAGGWRLKLDGLWSEPTGQHTAPLAITRRGASTCTLSGYPTVALLDAKGRELGFQYSHSGDQVIAPSRPRPVRIAAHGSAYFLVNKYRCDLRAVSAARFLRATLPGVRGSLTLRFLPRSPLMDYCPADPPSRTVAVSPIVGRLLQAVARPK